MLGPVLHFRERRLLLLEAVGTRQIARERRHQRDVHRVGDAVGGPVEVRADVHVVFGARRDEETVVDEYLLRVALVGVGRRATRNPSVDRLESCGVDPHVSIVQDAVEDVLAGFHVVVRDDEPRQLHARAGSQRRCQSRASVARPARLRRQARRLCIFDGAARIRAAGQDSSLR